jgi:hypothetical protein
MLYPKIRLKLSEGTETLQALAVGINLKCERIAVDAALNYGLLNQKKMWMTSAAFVRN